MAWTFTTAAAATAERTEPGTAPSVEEQPGPVFVPPELVRAVEPEYPSRALEEGVEAVVVLELDVDAEGAVEGVEVVGDVEPAGYGFDDAAVDAAFLFEFTPATEDGAPVPVRITYRMRFEVEEIVPEEPDEEPAAEEVPAPPPGDPVVNLRGELLERGTRLPLVGVLVTVFSGEGDDAIGYETSTDNDGNFEFIDLPTGRWSVLAEPEGYFPLRTSEEIAEGERVEAKYFLERGAYNPYDVLVEGEVLRKEVSRTTLEVAEIERVPGTFGDVLKVVQNLPGVAQTSPISGNIVVRGSAPEDTEIFVEGINVPIIYHFGGVRSVIPIGMIEKLDFYPGNFPSELGRATGGAINVGLKRLRPEKVGGYVDLNLVDAGAYIEAPLGDKLSVAVSARRSYIDSFLGAVVPDDTPVDVLTAPRYYDYQLLMSYRPTPANELKLFVFGSDDELSVLFDNPADLSPTVRADDATTSTRFYRTVLEYDFIPSARFENKLQISGGRNWLYFGLGDQFYLDINSYQAQVRDNMRVNLSDEVSILAGVDYLMSTNDTSIKLPQTSKEGEVGGRPDLGSVRSSDTKDLWFHSVGAYLEVEGRFFDRWTVVPGFRFDYFSQVDAMSLSPRLSTRFDLSDEWTLKGGVGLFYQEPFFDESDETFGNPELGLEKAVHYSAGVEYRPLPHLSFDVTGFYKDLQDLVSRSDEIVERDGQPVPQNFDNNGEGRVYGLEVLIRHDFANSFTGWLSYTFSRAERLDSGADEWRLFDYDQTHILSLLGTYTLPRNWSIGARWRLVSGNPTTPRARGVYQVDESYYSPTLGEVNSERLPLFHQLDLRVDKRWIFDNWMLTAYLDIQNVYNQANASGYSYNYDYTERAQRTALPILPVIGLKGEF